VRVLVNLKPSSGRNTGSYRVIDALRP